jgi:hypothetical protein
VAVVQTSAYRYVGLSTDVKPTTAPVPVIGARFVETDTGAEFEWAGAAWVNVTPQARDEPSD